MADLDAKYGDHGIIATSTAVSRIELNDRRAYTFTHLGLSTDGTTAATDLIYFARHSAVTPDLTQGINKGAIANGGSLIIPEGWEEIFFLAEANTPVLAMIIGPIPKVEERPFGKHQDAVPVIIVGDEKTTEDPSKAVQPPIPRGNR